MVLSKEQLQFIYSHCAQPRIDAFLPLLNKTMERYEIDTVARLCMFLAQVGHESAELRYTEEIASGVAYEGRKDLGNLSPGDGTRYKGRGLIQLTGKTNYTLCGLALDLPLLEHPELLSQYEPATLSAGWYWNNHNLNALCDLGLFEQLTRRINGGMNGYPNRYQLLQRAMSVIQ